MKHGENTRLLLLVKVTQELFFLFFPVKYISICSRGDRGERVGGTYASSIVFSLTSHVSCAHRVNIGPLRFERGNNKKKRIGMVSILFLYKS